MSPGHREAGAHEVTDEQLSKKLASAEASRSALHQNSQAEKHRRAEEEARLAAERKRIALARTPLDGDVTIEFDVTELPDHRVTLHGTTNLPTDTALMLSVEERSQGGFYGQSKCSVAADGTFRSEAFGRVGGLKDGVYIADVTMPVTKVQPDSAMRFMGTKGEKLTGPLVEKHELEFLGVTAHVEKEFTIGGPKAAAAQQDRERDRAKEYAEWSRKITDLHTRLEVARGMNDPAKWAEFARQFLMDIQSHQDELMQVEPITARFVIGDPLDAVRRMFHATAFKKPQEYDEASAEYMQSLKELQQFIAESESPVRGVTAGQEKALPRQAKSTDPSSEIIGSWLDTSPLLGGKITIFRKDGRFFMEYKYNDGSGDITELVETRSQVGRRFDYKPDRGNDEYYLIDSRGDLQELDRGGRFVTFKKLN